MQNRRFLFKCPRLSYLSAESFMPRAFNACHDTKLHEWVSDPYLKGLLDGARIKLRKVECGAYDK